jgi:hypothetical protein
MTDECSAVAIFEVRTTEAVKLFNRIVVEHDGGTLAYIRSLWPADAACWWCDNPVGEAWVSFIEHPTKPKTMLMLPGCTTCRDINPAERRKKTQRFLRAVWPRTKWAMRVVR